MDAYAVVETGGKQHLVRAEDVVTVERLDAAAGDQIVLGSVLACSDGAELAVGHPALEDRQVKAEILEHVRAKKVVAFKKKRRKGYHRKVGHRQEQTRVRIVQIG